jgi:hypothetical protein
VSVRSRRAREIRGGPLRLDFVAGIAEADGDDDRLEVIAETRRLLDGAGA